MHYNYQLNCGQFVLHDGNTPIGPCLDTVALAIDVRSHTLHKHGDPVNVQAWVANAKQKLGAIGQTRMAQDLQVLEGTFPVEELNHMLESSTYLPRFLTKVFLIAGQKPPIGLHLDDDGDPLLHGALYSVYQTQGSPSSGYLAYWSEDDGWLDADTLAPRDLTGDYAAGNYSFACRQMAPINTRI